MANFNSDNYLVDVNPSEGKSGAKPTLRQLRENLQSFSDDEFGEYRSSLRELATNRELPAQQAQLAQDTYRETQRQQDGAAGRMALRSGLDTSGYEGEMDRRKSLGSALGEVTTVNRSRENALKVQDQARNQAIELGVQDLETASNAAINAGEMHYQRQLEYQQAKAAHAEGLGSAIGGIAGSYFGPVGAAAGSYLGGQIGSSIGGDGTVDTSGY